MVELLVILDGAAERPGGGPTSLARARTPALDELCARGAVTALAITPPGFAPGSETGIPMLLGAPQRARPSRGRIEAAAVGIAVPPGHCAWRCDSPRRGPRPALAALAAVLPEHAVHHLRGHRFLAVGRERPAARLAGLRVWGDGAALEGALDRSTVIVCGPGAAAGVGRLLGACVEIPAGATGAPGSDLAAKARAARVTLDGGAARVVVHVGWPDESAHDRDPAGKVAGIEAADRELIGPLAAAVLRSGGRVRVCPDHGTDPRTGEHLADPVPAVVAGADVAPAGPARLIERGVVCEAAA